MATKACKIITFKQFSIAFTCLAMLFPATGMQAQNIVETTEQKETRMAWWHDAKFGMFIHWGIYAIPGRGEWVQWNEQMPVEEYAKLADQFKPAKFDADAWAATAKAAGMRYMVLTTRHHDGFCLFDSKASDFTSVKTAARRDFAADYVKAVRKAGLRVGFYYSPLDWRFPGFFFPDLQLKNAEAMREQYHRQMEELLTNYGPLDVLWFDGGEADWLNFGADWLLGAKWQKRTKDEHYKGRFNWEHDKVYAMIRQRQPQVIINGRADMPEDFHSREGDHALGEFDAEHPWELSTTLAGAWGWQSDASVKSLKDCVQLLVKTAGRDGNLLLNVGPRPDGEIDPPQVQRLREIGQWLEKYGNSIYGTRGGPFLPGDYGVSTHRDKLIYVHILNWPGDKLVLPAITAKIIHASVLTDRAAGFAQTEQGTEISVSPNNRDDIDTVVVLELDSLTDKIKPVSLDANMK
ncbi:MAG: alpha-L-fucosidase [Thermoguttaceae bacterium]|jgi:alpha-L-fucosidase